MTVLLLWKERDKLDLHIPYHIVKYATSAVHGALLTAIGLQILSRPENPVIYVNSSVVQVAIWGDIVPGKTANESQKDFVREGLAWLEQEGLITVKKVFSSTASLIDCSRLQMWDDTLEAHCESWSPERESKYKRMIESAPDKFGDSGFSPAIGPYWKTASGSLVILRYVTMTWEEFKILMAKSTITECERVMRYFLYAMSTTYAAPAARSGVGRLPLSEQSFEYGMPTSALTRYRNKLEEWGLLWVYRSESFQERIRAEYEESNRGKTSKKKEETLQKELDISPDYTYGRVCDRKKIDGYGKTIIDNPKYQMEISSGYSPKMQESKRLFLSAYQKHYHWLQGKVYSYDDLRHIYFTLFLENASRPQKKRRDLSDYDDYDFYLGEVPAKELMRDIKFDPRANAQAALEALDHWWFENTTAGKMALKRAANVHWDDTKSMKYRWPKKP